MIPFKKYVTYGAVLGLVQVIYLGILYVIGIEALSNFWFTLLLFPLSILLTFLFALRVRKEDFGGGWKFKDAFVAFFLMGVVGGIVTTVWSLFLYNVIDTSLGHDLTEQIMENTLEMMEKWGTPEGQIDKTMDDLAGLPEDFKPIGLLLSFAKSLVWFAILGMIGGLITRKSGSPASAIDQNL